MPMGVLEPNSKPLGEGKQGYFFKMDSIIKKSRQMLDRSFEGAGIDLTSDQWVLVKNLYGSMNMSQSQLAEVSGKDAATTTRILDLLEKKNITTRKQVPNDRRKYEIELTEKGNSVFKLAQQAVEDIRQIGLANLSDEECRTFFFLLDNIYRNICK
jgi:DNA-binding MarR family transcriptional regulator